MIHISNIRAFLSGAGSSDNLTKAYCGLVAIELILKHEVGLVDHNVFHGLEKFRQQKANGNKAWTSKALLGLINRLRNDITSISVNGKDGSARSTPVDSYPYIRYSRIEADGWSVPHTTPAQLAELTDTVRQLRTFLKTNFSLPL